ncbi:hypothetical protein MMAN_19740 [Mycobacterium mantenii]|uniref:DUF4145 domain-containing protein n=1 Tax=Mycobacterium mantenii TaxID=560555 RepID=A0ABM7JQL8_MYCNT|nr:DUF4145 domain-containing protein [Mycobacterium mantenii]MCV7245443.1 DUF4145 domain-containing protein [Mycobacterium mantenii]BBY37840.1 hypothetical protein MMAN_19740 [Mycobacterium mantenii]
MSWLEFTSQMTSTLSWPIVALATIVLLKSQLRKAAEAIVNLIDNLAELEFPGGKARFKKKVKELAKATDTLKDETSEATQPSRSQEITLPPETTSQRVTKYQQLAELDPRAAVLLPFGDLESLIRQKFKQMYPDKPSNFPFSRLVETLQEDGHLQDDTASMLRQMNTVRNEVAHKSQIEPELADLFIESVGNMIGYLLLTDFFKEARTVD